MNPLPPPFRPGVESPSFTGMMEEDGRPNSNSRYKRTGDPSMGRGHMNSWRGMPNCSETRTVLIPRVKMSTDSAEGPFDRKKVSTKVEAVDNALRISQFYLSKLDISEELAHSEVYKQYVNLRGGKSKASDDSLSSYVLPTTNDSIFQKAWDLYKNQRLEMKDVSMVKVDPLDSILKTRSDDVNKGDAAPTRNEEKQQDMGENEGLQSTLTTDPSEIVGDVKTVKDDTIGESGVESAISNNASPQNVRESEVEKWGESQTVPICHAASPDSDSAIAVRPMETDTSGKVGSDSIVGSGHDPTEAGEVASDEYELVNYGRIHLHSPESTH
ncbi:hypothetical protein MLD38_030442 [Melastoma candidum]|uniref:Uncharacterized protein n=1 Tax=Melastoma candidum TaxID=119954 RepID=A0ACB9MQ87_9MYRT|nr:hypothetical protein MLD38_030442 [Melastoma candidum]